MIDKGFHPLLVAELVGNFRRPSIANYYPISDKEKMKKDESGVLKIGIILFA